MEILKNPINWFSTTSLSNQAVVVIAILALAYLMVYGFMKIKKTSVPKIGASSIWKLFLSIISVTIIFLICYGFYLLAVYCWPTPERLTFKEMSRNLAENELRPEKKTLKSLNEKVEDGKTLTVEEKRAAMMAEEKIRMVRKEYSKGNLVAPPKPSPSPPETASMPKPPKGEVKEEVWDWVFEWEASEQQMASGQMVRGRVNEAQLLSLSCDALVLKFRYKRQQNGEIINLTLTRKNRNEPYFGRVAQKNLYLRVWLMPNPKEPGNFKGQFDNGPGTISLEVFLKKKI